MELIAKAEKNQNYEVYFGNAQNTSLKLTDMTIDEVRRWQTEYVDQGNPSSAVGRYQIINTTLDGLVNQLSVDESQKFDNELQDRFAVALIKRRGAEDYVNNEISAEEFAANLANGWAALPRVIGDKPNSSYYESDGLNQSRVSIEKVMHAVGKIQPDKTP